MIYRVFIIGCLLVVFCACGTDTSANKTTCKYGKPTAIFSTTMPSILQQSFTADQHTGVEKVTFSDGKILEITQSGCDKIRQVLKFHLPPTKATSNEQLLQTAVRQLAQLGDLAPSLRAFTFWAQAIEAQSAQFKKGMEIELEPRTYATIDAITASDETILLIVLEQRKE